MKRTRISLFRILIFIRDWSSLTFEILLLADNLDKLKIKIRLIIFNVVIIVTGCSISKTPHFIYFDEVLAEMDSDIAVESIDIISFLYIEPKLITVVDSLAPHYLEGYGLDINDANYKIEDIDSLQLLNNFNSIEDFLKTNDKSFEDYLMGKFRINQPNQYLYNKIPVYDNKALLVYDQNASVFEFVIEFHKPKTLFIGIARTIIK